MSKDPQSRFRAPQHRKEAELARVRARFEAAHPLRRRGPRSGGLRPLVLALALGAAMIALALLLAG